MSDTTLRRGLAGLGTAQDRLSAFTFVLAQVCLLGIVSAYVYETVSRYFFSAPTSWSNEVVSYALCVGVFLALPEVTRLGGHIAITAFYDSLRGVARRRVGAVLALVSGGVCLFVAWICLQAAIRHIATSEMTVGVNPIPKAWISVWLPYGFGSAGIHFLRQAFGSTPAG